ncbi:MAG: amidase [Proteobacteria bacterium]|nr:amidase [Pseudomonadota bacterium]
MAAGSDMAISLGTGSGDPTSIDYRQIEEAPMSLRRREFLWSCAGLVAMACGGAPRLGAERPSVDLPEADALGQAAGIRRGDVTSRELVEATIQRIEALDPPINSVVTRFFGRALAAADGPLPDGPFRGVPYLLKDLNDLAGTRKTMGSRLFADFVSTQNSPNTQASLDAGLVILGKTNTPEFGLVATTESALLGACRNPWSLDHSTGGSSGGAAAAVAAGILPMAQASDGGGSIRIPASCCGVFGLKPSRGRNPSEFENRSIDIAVRHCVSRSVRDSAAYLSVTEQRGAGAPLAPTGFVEGASPRRLRVGFHTRNAYGNEADPQVRAAVEDTARLCEALGHRVAEATPDYDGEAFVAHFLSLWTAVPDELLRGLEARGVDPSQVLEPVTIGMAHRFRRQPAGAMARAIGFFGAYERRIDAFFDDHDVLLSPVLRTPPIPLGTQGGTLPFEQVFEPMLDYASYTPVFNAAGNPAMSVPLGWSREGLPIGSQFAARIGGEATLLALAYELEQARPWADRHP